MRLDDVTAFGAVDPAGALDDVEASPAQWASGRDAARKVLGGSLDLAATAQVLVTGMGGSGISGDVAAALATTSATRPVGVHKGYDLPAYVGADTLVVAVSHSGNTEETVSAAEAALERGARLVAVTGGGTLRRLCEEAGVPRVPVPTGGQPRHALGHLAAPVLVALGLDDGLDEAVDLGRRLVARWGRTAPTAENAAKQLGERIAGGRLTAVYGARGMPAVAAYRLKCQLNENAKRLAVSAELPELDHNEIVGWQEADEQARATGVVWLRDPAGEHPRIVARVDATRRLLDPVCAWVVEHAAEGRSALARLLSLLVFADLASVYAAVAADRDPTPIGTIDRLKAELAAATP